MLTFFLVINHDPRDDKVRKLDCFRFDDPDDVIIWLWGRDLEDFTIIKYQEDDDVGLKARIIMFDPTQASALGKLKVLLEAKEKMP